MQNHTVAMIAASDYRRDNYGVLFESATVHSMTGKGLHNRTAGHVVEVWENRPSLVPGSDQSVLVDPFGRPTEDRHTVLMQAVATVLSASPIGTERAYGDTIAIGDTVTLSIAGLPGRTYAVTAGRLSDPVLVPVA